MKIAIISDIHNNTTNLKKVLDYCNNEEIKTLICCGDLASMETLEYLTDNFSGEIFYCFGNMDDGQMRNYDFKEKYRNTWIFRDYGAACTDNKNIAFTHYPEAAKKLCGTEKYDFVFYGHTHKPWEETIGKCKVLNPGNVAGEIYPPTFAVWETENNNFELIRVHDLK